MAFLAPVAPYLAVASAGMQALGSIQQGNAAAAAAGYNAKIAEQNAQLARQKAAWAAAEGEQNLEIAGLESKNAAGKIKANQAASGINVKSGSAVAVQKSQAEMAMLNEMNIRSNAARKAYGYETDATSYEAQAQLDKAQGKNAKTAGYIGAAGSLLGGASEYSKYSSYLNDKSLGVQEAIDTSNLPSGQYGPVYEQ